MKPFAVLLFVVFAYLPCKSQSEFKQDTIKVFTVKQLRADFVYFKSALETVHPSLYRYRVKDSVDSYFLNGLNKIDHPMGQVEFWELLQHIVAKIGSGHTNLTPGDKIVNARIYGVHNTMPFYIYIANNRIYVKGYAGRPDSSFLIGDEVLAINGEPAFSLLVQERNLLAGDGYSHIFKDYQLEHGAFNGIYATLHGEKTSFSVTFKSGNRTKTKSLNAITVLRKETGEVIQLKSTKSLHYVAAEQNNDSVVHQVIYPSDIPSTAILKLVSFTYTDYSVFHKKLFKDLKQKNIENLVIDLRNNTGGNDDVCIDLMKYFMDKDFYFTRINEEVTNVKNMVELTHNIAITKPAYIDFSQIGHKLYQVKADANRKQHSLSAFKGKLYLLINKGTFSAASLMATAIKEQIQCTTIGEETGGGRAGCDGGTVIDILLPNTLFKLKVPLQWTYSLTSAPNYGDGLKPDIVFVPTAFDIYNEQAKQIDSFTRIMKSAINANQ